MTACEIVIPYWQREEGVLFRALESIFAQTFQDFRIIVVDDESPCRASVDVEKFTAEQQAKIQIIYQKNTKQAGARNTGLNACSADTPMVAFLDSDDMWEPDHLERAANLFQNHGVDFYYASVYRDEQFNENYELPTTMIHPELRRDLEGVEGVFEITNMPKVMTGQWFRHMHLSPTVMSGKIASQVRFDRSLMIAEDYDFLVSCALLVKKPVATDVVGVKRATGDNIWHKVKTTSLMYCIEKYYSMNILKKLDKNATIDGVYKEVMNLRIQSYREIFYWSQRDRLKAKMQPLWGVCFNWIKDDPQILLFIASMIFKTNKNGGKTLIPGDDA